YNDRQGSRPLRPQDREERKNCLKIIKMAKNKEEGNINTTLDAIRMKFGEESIMKLGDKPKVGVDAISTGSIGLDAALGVGGLPRGRIIEIFGPESSGKTTLSLHVIAEAQKTGGICAFCHGPGIF
ncbi:MAG: Protein RecA, partial [Candidatus Azambacteria bacterium GW2011_GWE1_42_9]